MNPVSAIFEAYNEGYRALRLSGRSFYDLIADERKLRPTMEVLRQVSRSQYGLHMITYSMAGGLDWDGGRFDNAQDRKSVENILKSHQLLNIPQDQNEVARVIRGISLLSRTPNDSMKWSDGRNLRFLFIIEFAEHLLPGSLTNGSQTDSQLIAIELAHLTANSLALRASGNMIIFHGRDGLIDDLVCGALHTVRLPQPDVKEKVEFLAAASDLYVQASFEEGLTLDAVANLTVNTPNRGLEQLIRASHFSGRKLTGREMSQQKNQDVENLSEGTLQALDTSRVDNLQLKGLNIETAKVILSRYAASLLRNDSSMPANVLLVGPPGTGKTDLAVLTAYQAKAAAYQMHSPKGGIVGETERKSRLQQTILKEWTPNIAFCDEITESMPLQRNDFDGDSGASKAVTASLLTALSDESRRGKSLLVATTNCPWRMGAAMRSRFTILPLLHPLKEDYAHIVVATAKRVNNTADFTADDARIIQASAIFYEKGANPRHIRFALSNALHLTGKLDPEAVLLAADDLCASTDYDTAVYADLWAVKVCTSRSFLPWNESPEKYPFPEHLRGVVDAQTGAIHHSELDKRLKEYGAHANI